MVSQSKQPSNNETYIRGPIESTLLLRLDLFIIIRWVAIAGVIILTQVAQLAFSITLSTLPVYITCAFLAAFNIVLIYQVRSLKQLSNELLKKRISIFSTTHIILDYLAFVTILHFTGGINNPFLFLAVLHIIGASTLLRRVTVFSIATLVIFMVALLFILEYTGIIPHIALAGFAPPTLYKEPLYILAVMMSLITVLYSSAYIATTITSGLRKRQEQLMELLESRLNQTIEERNRLNVDISTLKEERERFLRFLSIASHDLKAPLTAIQSYFGVMLGGFSGELNEKQRSMIERSSIRITELLNLISNLLDIPRIETGQLVQEMKEFSLIEVIDKCQNELRGLAEQKGISLKTELPETLPGIYGSAPRIQQVITNLLVNAISYTSEGEVIIRASKIDKLVQVDVLDTGIGVLAEEQPRIFSDFFRGSNVKSKGTGLGLSISKRIIEAHGGNIWLESPYHGSSSGSKFSFTLPTIESQEVKK